MLKEQEENFEDVYDFSDDIYDMNDEIDCKENSKREERKKFKERKKRIEQKNIEEKEQFDFDTEIVIGMTNRNNQNRNRETQKKLTKKQAQMIRKKKKIKRFIKWTSLFFIIIGGIVFALVSPIFNIDEIQVFDNNQISSDTIVSLSQLQLGQNIFRFDSNKVKSEIKTNPYIENVKVSRKIPSKIEITVEERKKNYNVEFLNGYAYINNQGYILEISEQKLDLPIIQGIETKQEQIVAGNRLDSQDLAKLEVVIQIMNICKSYNLENKVTSIDISDRNNYSIYMEEERKTIYLGDESSLSNKMLYIPTILTENQGKEGNIYIDKDTANKFKARFREKV